MESVVGTAQEALRAAGISGQKARYLKDMAERFLDGTITPARFLEMTDEEIVAQLTKVKGIGRWTAEVFLIFALGRPDVLPVSDLGLRRAVRQNYGTAEDALEEEIRQLGEQWRPYRGVAAWYLWKSLEGGPLRETTS